MLDTDDDETSSTAGVFRVAKLGKLLRLFRLLRLFKLQQFVESFNEILESYDINLESFASKFKIVIAASYICHLSACVFGFTFPVLILLNRQLYAMVITRHGLPRVV